MTELRQHHPAQRMDRRISVDPENPHARQPARIVRNPHYRFHSRPGNLAGHSSSVSHTIDVDTAAKPSAEVG